MSNKRSHHETATKNKTCRRFAKDTNLLWTLHTVRCVARHFQTFIHDHLLLSCDSMWSAFDIFLGEKLDTRGFWIVKGSCLPEGVPSGMTL